MFSAETWRVLCCWGMHTSFFNEDCLLLLYETLTILSSLLVTSINAHLKSACNLVLPFLLCVAGWSWTESSACRGFNEQNWLGFCGGGSCPFIAHHHTCEAGTTGQIFTDQHCSHLEFNKHFCCHTLNHLSSFLLYARSNIYSQALYTTKCCLGVAEISYSGSKDVWMQLADEVTNVVNSQAVPAATGNKCQAEPGLGSHSRSSGVTAARAALLEWSQPGLQRDEINPGCSPWPEPVITCMG